MIVVVGWEEEAVNACRESISDSDSDHWTENDIGYSVVLLLADTHDLSGSVELEHMVGGGECRCVRDQELCKSRGGRPGLPVLNSTYGLRGCKATLN